jgi:hypothetical protein
MTDIIARRPPGAAARAPSALRGLQIEGDYHEMRAFELRRNGGDGRFVSSAIESVYIAPWTSDLAASHPRPATGDLMEALFLAQQSLYEREAPHATPGGALIVAELLLGSTKTWMQCNVGRLNGESAGLAPRPDRVLHP